MGETTRDPRVRHRCALFDDTIGLTCERLAIDSMHTIYLGSAQEWVSSLNSSTLVPVSVTRKGSSSARVV